MKSIRLMAIAVLLLAVFGCNQGDKGGNAKKDAALDAGKVQEAKAFIDAYTEKFLTLYAEASEAEWKANTYIVEGDEEGERAFQETKERFAAHTGSVENIEKARALLEHKDVLEPLQVKQLEVILYNAADAPQTEPELVKKRIEAEARQVKTLYGFNFQVDGKKLSPNDIDRVLLESNNLDERLKVWSASKDVGKALKDGLVQLVDLRNKTVQGLGYKNFFDYQVSEYGMTSEEMIAMVDQFNRELRPLFRELHTWTRHYLAERYGVKEVPDLIPAHWLPDRWGQKWGSLVSVDGIDLTSVLEKKDPEFLITEAENFYVSLGYEKLPASFYEKSSLYPLPPDAKYAKNTHASAWHMDLQHDLRSLMSVEPNERWWVTTHHELGHIYYYMAYTNPDVPPLLRRGANRAFHEAIGYLLGLASTQKPYLVGRGLIAEGVETDETRILLKEALDYIVFMPFGSGTMSHFERDLYDGLNPEEYNKRWWDHAARFQGIAPPSERGEDFCDAATKTHINDDPGQYYDYALSYVILHQFHRHIARNILKQDPHATNYYGNKDIGAFLHGILKQGNTNDWRRLMVDNLGEEISAKAMLEYFEPLMKFLKEQNEGRAHTLPEL